MYKVRLSFYKKGYAKFVSHLDLMRMFQRIFKIAGVDIAFSQGFNPHPKMSIAHPLPVGVTSDEEYLDIQLNSMPDYDRLVSQINKAMPEDIKILRAWEPIEAMNLLCLSKYTVKLTLREKVHCFEDIITAFKNMNEIVVSKKTKKGIADVDIKPWIKSFDILESDGTDFTVSMLLSTGEKANLKAFTVLDALAKYIPEFKLLYCDINRDCILKENMAKIDV
ncbi:MAG: DUF2344 domain-containing protein [Clostridia bacterium]|nr:DUF2344 domain-containing protein [Clostridia bacterium]